MTQQKDGLGRDVRRTLTGNLAYAMGQWLLLIIIARFGSVEQVGFVTLATAIITPAFALAGLSLREARAVDIESEFLDTDYFGLRAITVAIAIVVSVAAVIWTGRGEPAAFVAIALGVLLTKPPHVQATLNYGFCQRAGRFDLMQQSLVARAALGLALFAVVFIGTGSLPLAFAAQALGWLGVLMLMDIPKLRAAGITTHWGTWDKATRARILRLLIWVLPLAISTGLAVAVVSAPRIVLAEYAGFVELGLFGAIFYFLTANQLLITAVTQASVSRLARAYDAANRTRLIRTLLRVLAINSAAGALLMIAAWTVGEPVVRLMYGPEYVQPFLIMAVAIVGALRFLSGTARFALNAVKRFNLSLAMNLATLAVAIGVALWLVPTRGAEGAAIAAIAAEAARLILASGLLVGVIRRMPA